VSFAIADFGVRGHVVAREVTVPVGYKGKHVSRQRIDMLVDNKPEDALAGRDRQLEAAVEELMKQLNGSKRNVATEGQQQK